MPSSLRCIMFWGCILAISTCMVPAWSQASNSGQPDGNYTQWTQPQYDDAMAWLNAHKADLDPEFQNEFNVLQTILHRVAFQPRYAAPSETLIANCIRNHEDSVKSIKQLQEAADYLKKVVVRFRAGIPVSQDGKLWGLVYEDVSLPGTADAHPVICRCMEIPNFSAAKRAAMICGRFKNVLKVDPLLWWAAIGMGTAQDEDATGIEPVVGQPHAGGPPLVTPLPLPGQHPLQTLVTADSDWANFRCETQPNLCEQVFSTIREVVDPQVQITTRGLDRAAVARARRWDAQQYVETAAATFLQSTPPDWKGATACYVQAILSDPSFPEAYRLLSQELEAQGQKLSAQQITSMSDRLSSNDPLHGTQISDQDKRLLANLKAQLGLPDPPSASTLLPIPAALLQPPPASLPSGQ